MRRLPTALPITLRATLRTTLRTTLLTTLLLVQVAVACLLAKADAASAQEPDSTPAAANHVYLPVVARTSGLIAPLPAAGAAEQSLNTYLAWQFFDPSVPDPRFTILLEAGDDTPDVTMAENLAARYFDPATFELDSVYYWQVIATNAAGARQAGPVWSFHTEAPFAQPPTGSLVTIPTGSLVTIPAGEFQMGCDVSNAGPGLSCSHKDMPLHAVWLDAYAIDRFEVTNQEYAACVAAGQCQPPRRSRSHGREDYYGNPAYALYPVLYVSHWDAADYCAWAGKRLPSEAEWEKAARGPVDTRPFPWGSEPADCSRQNRPLAELCPDQPDDTARVGSFPRGASVYGVHDLGGNAFEWVLDQYSESWYKRSPYLNPVNTNQGQGDAYTLRGGSYRDRIAYTRVFHRHWGHHGDTVGGDAPYYRNDRVGFRCAVSLP